MTRPEIREALYRLHIHEQRELHGITVLRTPLGWSVNGQGVVALETAVTIYDTLRRIRG